jgi:hypothetical protein
MDEMTEQDKDALAQGLHAAWGKYVELFGEDPHGTYRQLRAMLEFLPKGGAQ